MALVEERQVASDQEVINRFRPSVGAPLLAEELPELLQVGPVGVQGMAGDIALGGEITDELVDFVFHVAAFSICCSPNGVVQRSLRLIYSVAKLKGSGFSV